MTAEPASPVTNDPPVSKAASAGVLTDLAAMRSAALAAAERACLMLLVSPLWDGRDHNLVLLASRRRTWFRGPM